MIAVSYTHLHATPLLDQLESGPWPRFVSDIKKEAAARTEEKSADGGKPETESLYAAERASVKEETAKAEEAKRTEDKIRADKEEDFEPVIRHNDAEEDRERGEINPYTGREYQSNSVRMHPTRCL